MSKQETKSDKKAQVKNSAKEIVEFIKEKTGYCCSSRRDAINNSIKIVFWDKSFIIIKVNFDNADPNASKVQLELEEFTFVKDYQKIKIFDKSDMEKVYSEIEYYEKKSDWRDKMAACARNRSLYAENRIRSNLLDLTHDIKKAIEEIIQFLPPPPSTRDKCIRVIFGSIAVLLPVMVPVILLMKGMPFKDAYREGITILLTYFFLYIIAYIDRGLSVFKF